MIHEDLKKAIERFAPFTEKELSYADRFFKIKKVKKNEYYLREGEVMGSIGFVVSGLLRCYYNIKNKEITTEFLLPRSIAASMLSFLTNKPQGEYNYIRIEKRTICLQTLNARERLEYLQKKAPDLFKKKIPLQYIASYLGMSPETFSRIRSK